MPCSWTYECKLEELYCLPRKIESQQYTNLMFDLNMHDLALAILSSIFLRVPHSSMFYVV